MIDPPVTLLGSAGAEGLVPYEAKHWSEISERDAAAAHARKVANDGLAVALDMSALVRTVVVAGRVECIVGLWLAPGEEGAPWVMAPHPDPARFERAIELCRPFIAECQTLRPLLVVERPIFDEPTRTWLAGLGFRLVEGAPMETWRLEQAG